MAVQQISEKWWCWKWNLNQRWVEEVVDCGNADMAVIWETLGMQTGAEWKDLIIVNEENGCDKKNKVVPEEVTLSESPH